MSNRPRISRRAAISAAGIGALSLFAKAHGMKITDSSIHQNTKFLLDRDHKDLVLWDNVHDGDGTIRVKIFHFDDAAKPSLLLIYNIPPGGSEGVHTHNVGDEKMGSYDEFYYILAGEGEMEIADEKLTVSPGDHVYTPNGVAHGIRNTSTEHDLKLFLTAVAR